MSIDNIGENVVKALINLKDCPFCDAGKPNIFKVKDSRYVDDEMNWVLECKTMGCIFQQTSPDRSLFSLVARWNTRAKV